MNYELRMEISNHVIARSEERATKQSRGDILHAMAGRFLIPNSSFLIKQRVFFSKCFSFISNTIMSNNKRILLAMAALIVMAMTVTTARSQTYKPDWMTKAVLAGGGNDVTNTVTLTVASGGAAPITLTLPNAYAAGAGYVLASTTSGGLSWVPQNSSVTLSGDVTGSSGSNTIATTAGPHIVAALNTSGVAKSMNADVLNYDATLKVATNALGIDLTHPNGWTGQQTFTDATANAAAATFTNSFVNSSGTALGATISSTGAGTSINTALQLTASGSSGTNTALDVTGGSVKIEPFSTAGIVHNASTGVLSSSLIVTGDITDANVTYAKIQNVAASSLLGNPTGSPATASGITLGTGLGFSGTTIVNTGVVSVDAGAGGGVTIAGTGSGPYTGAVTATLDMTHPNIWTGTQTLGGVALTKTAVSSISADQNDWALGTTNSFFTITSSAPVNITGIAGGVAGRVIVLVNIGSSTITLNNENTGSTAGNRIHLAGASDVILAGDGTVTLLYDGTAARWRMIAAE